MTPERWPYWDVLVFAAGALPLVLAILIGTFVAETDDEPIRYGIVRQLGTFNLIHAVFHEWIGIAKDVWSAPWRHKLSYLWREPGWSHDGSRATSAMIKERWAAGRPVEEPAE